MDRISADGTMGKAAAAEPSVVDGVCRRTARIGNCEDVAPMSHYWGEGDDQAGRNLPPPRAVQLRPRDAADRPRHTYRARRRIVCPKQDGIVTSNS